MSRPPWPARRPSRPLRDALRRFRRAGEPMPRHRAGLLALLGAGGALRLWFMAGYRPAFVGYPDARAYIIAARGPLYWNYYKPVGYPLLLRALRALDGRLSTTIAAQHALGLATGALVYGATVPHVRRRELALLPAGLALLGGSQVSLEHAVLSDGPFAFLLGVAMGCATCAIRSSAPAVWLAGAGTTLATAATLRTVGITLVPAWAAWGLSLPARRRWNAPAALLAAAGITLAAYLVPQARATGHWGLTRSAGFAWYGRLAPLADPARFTPPPGTEALAEDSDPRSRPNLNWYLFDPSSPALRAYGAPPWPLHPVAPEAYRWAGEEPVRRFAREVVRRQPTDYAASVLEGLANYVVPRFGRRSVFEYDQPMLVRELRNPRFEQLAIADITAYYTTTSGYRRRWVAALETYGRAVRTEGAPTASLAVLALTGCVAARGPDRSAAALFAGTALVLAAVPVATLFYDVRYAAPMSLPLAAAAAIGLDGLIERYGRRTSTAAS